MFYHVFRQPPRWTTPFHPRDVALEALRLWQLSKEILSKEGVGEADNEERKVVLVGSLKMARLFGGYTM